MRDDTNAERAKLDHKKLLGFRNLVPVSKDTTDLRESSEIAFNKKGTESVA